MKSIEDELERKGVPEHERRSIAFRLMLITKVSEAWKQAAIDEEGRIVNAAPAIELMMRKFMTAGDAVASFGMFDLIGRWAEVPRAMNVHTPGPKRRLLDADDCDGDAERIARMYWTLPTETGSNREAARCHELVPTAPSRPPPGLDTFNTLSKPLIPKWYEGGLELENDWAMEDDYATEDIMMGDQ